MVDSLLRRAPRLSTADLETFVHLVWYRGYEVILNCAAGNRERVVDS